MNQVLKLKMEMKKITKLLMASAHYYALLIHPNMFNTDNWNSNRPKRSEGGPTRSSDQETL